MKLRFSLSFFLLILFLACLFLWPSSTKAAVLSRAPNNLGLVGYWPLNEGVGTQAGDFSGKGNHGTLTGGPTWTSGKFGRALDFGSAAQSHVEIDPVANYMQTGDFTVSFWFYPVFSGYTQGLFRLGDAPSSNDMYVNFTPVSASAGNVTFAVFTGATFVGPQATLQYNRWYHITATFSTTNGRTLYINGAYISNASDTTRGTTPYSTHASFGSEGDEFPTGNYTNGKLDEVRVYNRELIASDVAKLYQAGAVAVKKVISVGSGSNNCAVSTSCAITYSATPGNLLVVSGRSLNVTDSGILSVTDNVGNIYTSALNTKFSGNHITFAYYACAPKAGVTTINVNVTTASEMAVQVLEYSGMAQTNCFDQVSSVNSGTTNLLADTSALTPSRSGELSVGIFQHTTNGSSAFTDSSNGYTCVNRFDTIDNDTTAQCYKVLASAVPVKAYAGHTLGGNTWWGHQLLFKPASFSANSSQNKTGGTIDSGLIGLWSFNGADMNWGTNKALDRSGNSNNGDIKNMSTSSSPTAGKIGQGLKFDGQNDAIFISDSITTNTVTVCAWIYPVSIPATGAVMNNSRFSLNITSSQNRLQLDSNTSAGSSLLSSINSISINVWHHVCAVRNSGTNGPGSIYINGALDASGDTDTPVTGFGLAIGNDQFGTYPFPGKIDDVRIYNRALSASEVKQLYDMGR